MVQPVFEVLPTTQLGAEDGGSRTQRRKAAVDLQVLSQCMLKACRENDISVRYDLRSACRSIGKLNAITARDCAPCEAPPVPNEALLMK